MFRCGYKHLYLHGKYFFVTATSVKSLVTYWCSVYKIFLSYLNIKKSQFYRDVITDISSLDNKLIPKMFLPRSDI